MLCKLNLIAILVQTSASVLMLKLRSSNQFSCPFNSVLFALHSAGEARFSRRSPRVCKWTLRVCLRDSSDHKIANISEQQFKVWTFWHRRWDAFLTSCEQWQDHWISWNVWVISQLNRLLSEASAFSKSIEFSSHTQKPPKCT